LPTHCVVDGCERPRWARGWCGTHYRRWSRTGDVAPGVAELPRSLPKGTPYERVMATVRYEDGHWLTASTGVHGYGQVHGPGKTVLRSHRVVYEHHRGDIPAGLELDHLCR